MKGRKGRKVKKFREWLKDAKRGIVKFAGKDQRVKRRDRG
jgi:hypothetical protein